MSSSAPPKFTNATLRFALPPSGDVPAFVNIDDNGNKEQNYTNEEKQVVIENLRTREWENAVTLDVQGFQLFGGCPATHKAFTNDEEIRQEYYPETAKLVKKLTGASWAMPFHHKIRCRDKPKATQPYRETHIDESASNALKVFHRFFPPSGEPSVMPQRRFQIFSVWRPISHPAYDSPLALCDYRSVKVQEDTFPLKLVVSKLEIEILVVRYNENHKWGYFYGVTPEEVILIKCYDSAKDENIAIFSPHSAFEDPATPEGSLPRQSIEVRVLVVYDW